MKVLKFGGKSLDDSGIDKVIDIAIKQAKKEQVSLVVSARGNTTDDLESLIEKAISERITNRISKPLKYIKKMALILILKKNFHF